MWCFVKRLLYFRVYFLERVSDALLRVLQHQLHFRVLHAVQLHSVSIKVGPHRDPRVAKQLQPPRTQTGMDQRQTRSGCDLPTYVLLVRLSRFKHCELIHRSRDSLVRLTVPDRLVLHLVYLHSLLGHVAGHVGCRPHIYVQDLAAAQVRVQKARDSLCVCHYNPITLHGCRRCFQELDI
jgi:hypothetical protein